jgi:hypothetical protein
VAALLPPSGGMVIVTSRRELPELLADRAKAIRLKPLTTPQALQLLAQRITWARVGGDLLAARQIVDACGRVPMAVAIAAGRIASASEEHVPLRELARRLQDTRLRLTHLNLGERSVETAIRVSYELLTEPQRHVLHVAALLNAPELDVEVVAEAGDISRQDARQLLDELVDLHLLGVTGPPGDRWYLHQLVDDYAHREAVRRLTPEQQAAIIARAVRVYLRRARTLKELLASPAARLDPELAAWARAELARQRANVLAILWVAVRMPVQLAILIVRAIIEVLLAVIIGWPEAVPAFESVLEVSRAARDQLLEAKALYGLALHVDRMGDPEQALRLLRRSADLASVVGGDEELVRRVHYAIAHIQGHLSAPDPRTGDHRVAASGDAVSSQTGWAADQDGIPPMPEPVVRQQPQTPLDQRPSVSAQAGSGTGGSFDGRDDPGWIPGPPGGPTPGSQSSSAPPPPDDPGHEWPRGTGGPPPTTSPSPGGGARAGSQPNQGYASAAASAAAASAEQGSSGSARSHLHDVIDAADEARGDSATPGPAVFG